MIHEVVVPVGMTQAELKKLFRKKLMTGGAVVCLPRELSESDLQHFFDEFSQGVKANNVNSLVLVQLARELVIPCGIIEQLASLGVDCVSTALLERPDLPNSVRANLLAGISEALRLKLEISAQKSFICDMGDVELRQYYKASIGDDSMAVAMRIALCNHLRLPGDICQLLAKDRVQKVRFAARNLRK